MVPRSHEAAPWPRRDEAVPPAAARGIVRKLGIGAALLAALLVIAAWAVPPMLDWGRFRAAIAAIAGAQLGRTIRIGGDVSLRLFPEAVLTASDVTLPEQGDGMSARIANLRLEVALGPLLAGKLVVRDLVLGSPVVTLPWPLPSSLMNPVRPHVPHPFAAHVENGALHMGLAAITGITAAIHGSPSVEPAAGQAPDAPPLSAFGAEGFAAFDGQRWRFTTALGAPDADGVSAVDLAMQGQGPAHDTGGALQGTLSDGTLQGHLHAAGPNLALIMPSSPLSWQADAPFIATGARIVSSALHMSLGGAPATASIALQLAPPARLDARLTASTLDLDGWGRLLNGAFAGFDPPAIPMRLDLAADSATLLGGVLGAVSGVLRVEDGHATLENVTAQLPGDAKLDFSGKIAKGEHAPLTVEGPATLDAPDLHATLAWLRPLAPPLLDSVPGGVLHGARLSGTARLATGALSVQGITGSLDGVPMSGGLALDFGAHPHFAATVSLDHVSLDDWLGGHGWGDGATLAEAAKRFTSAETALHLRSGSASWNGQDFHDVALDAATGAAGLRIDHATAGWANATVDFAGALGPDGALADLHGHVATRDATSLLAKLPPDWRWAPGLWQGEAAVAFSADGPPDALTLQLRASAGDLVAEAESVRDTLNGTADTTLTLRHPGAPRLLASLGVAGGEHFLETGSLAFLAHLHSLPGHVLVKDFTLDAAALHLGGHGALDFSGGEPGVDADLRSASLALPDVSALASLKVKLPKLHGRIRLAAEDVAVGGALVAHGVDASVTAGEGVFLADKLVAYVAGGHFAGDFALDTTHEQPAVALRGDLTGFDLAGLFPSAPLGIDTGKADLSLDIASAGLTDSALLGHLSGDARVTLHDAHITGFDLGRLDSLLTARVHPARAPLLQALTQGGSGGFSGSGTASLAHGKLTLDGVSVSSGDGVVSATGTMDMPSGAIDVSIGLAPAIANPPHYALRVTGTSHDLKVQPDLGKSPQRTVRRPLKK